MYNDFYNCFLTLILSNFLYKIGYTKILYTRTIRPLYSLLGRIVRDFYLNLTTLVALLQGCIYRTSIRSGEPLKGFPILLIKILRNRNRAKQNNDLTF